MTKTPMLLTILKHPNSKLKQKSNPVEDFDENLHQFLDDMYETMIHSGGIGLAAIQVGKPIRALVINIPREIEGAQPELQEDGSYAIPTEQRKEDLLEIINPVFLKQDGRTLYKEGCLSVPGFFEDIDRFESVSVAYQDRFGKEHILQADGTLAICLQHEIDHLNGILFVDKLPILRRKKFEKELKKLQKEQKQNFKPKSTQES